MKDNFEKRATAVAQRIAEDLDSQLHLVAEAKGWEKPIHLEAKAGKLTLSYDPSDKSDIFTSEYGNQNKSPNAVVRPFLNASEPIIAAEIEEEALSYLFEIGALP